MTNLDEVWNAAVDLLPSTSGIYDTIGDLIGTSLNNTVGRFLYAIVSAVNWIISFAYQFFEVFSGQMKVSYKGDYTYLTNFFFENSVISGIYWGMAIIGVVLCFAFTIIAVVRKMFDGSDKIQTSMGALLGSMLKSILIILSLNVVMVVVLNFSNVLMQRIVYVFNAGSSLTESQEIEFTDDQFATMGRVLNTIGNYSLNPSYNSRYNLNSCFNEIRSDMLYLQDQGVFAFYYITKDVNGNEIDTWQSALQTLVFAADLEQELKMDVYNEGVANALLGIMDTLKTNTAFYPLDRYERTPAPINNIPFDRVLFLACTYNAALNEQFNINPSHTDALRGPYYSGQKSIYDVYQVSEDFDLLWGFNYVMFFLIVWAIMKEMIYVLLDCVARIYNMVVLYLVAPPFIALTPLDNGAKLKQWILAFVVQCFGVFGTVVSMRVLLTFAPMVISSDLQLFPNAVMDIWAKVIMINAGCLAARKASAMITGILADSAGWQSITAGNLRSEYDEMKRKAAAGAGGGGGYSGGGGGVDQQVDADTAKSAGKLAAGAGDAKDAKKVADAAKENKNRKDGGGKDTKQGTGKGGGSEKKEGTGKEGAGKDGGSNEKKEGIGKDGGGKDGGGNMPNPTNTQSTAGTQNEKKDDGNTGKPGGDKAPGSGSGPAPSKTPPVGPGGSRIGGGGGTGSGKVGGKKVGGFSGIPVPPKFPENGKKVQNDGNNNPDGGNNNPDGGNGGLQQENQREGHGNVAEGDQHPPAEGVGNDNQNLNGVENLNEQIPQVQDNNNPDLQGEHQEGNNGVDNGFGANNSADNGFGANNGVDNGFGGNAFGGNDFGANNVVDNAFGAAQNIPIMHNVPPLNYNEPQMHPQQPGQQGNPPQQGNQQGNEQEGQPRKKAPANRDENQNQ